MPVTISLSPLDYLLLFTDIGATSSAKILLEHNVRSPKLGVTLPLFLRVSLKISKLGATFSRCFVSMDH